MLSSSVSPSIVPSISFGYERISSFFEDHSIMAGGSANVGKFEDVTGWESEERYNIETDPREARCVILSESKSLKGR